MSAPNSKKYSSSEQKQALLTSIGDLRSQLEEKIRVAKTQLAVRQQRPIPPPVPLLPPSNPLPSLPPPPPHLPPQQRALGAGRTEVRRQLCSKIERVRLDLDLLLARQHCLQERQKLQRLQQLQKEQQKLQLKQKSLNSRVRSGQRTSSSRTPLRFRRSLSGSAGKFVFRRCPSVAVSPGNRPDSVNRLLKRQISGGSGGGASNSLDLIRRSRTLVARAKLRLRKKRVYCVFYCRFGYCRRASNCIYLHDPNMVAICKRFLRRGGACDAGESCRLSHCLDPAKLPSCEFYDTPAGCSRPACPYRHVRYPEGTADCPDFRLLGHCRRGGDCPLRHVWPVANDRPEKPPLSSEPSGSASDSPAVNQAPKKGKLDESYIPVPRHVDEDGESDVDDEVLFGDD